MKLSNKYIAFVANEINVPHQQVAATAQLFDDGNTLPFICRYRKEITGNLDERKVEAIKTWIEKIEQLEKRKTSIIKSISKLENVPGDLVSYIEDCYSMAELEELYKPFKTTRKTKADEARAQGLEPLADAILEQRDEVMNTLLQRMGTSNKMTAEIALEGARQIAAEKIALSMAARKCAKQLIQKGALICSKVKKGKEGEAVKYTDYFDYKELLSKCPSHRFLAMARGAKEKYLTVTIDFEHTITISALEKLIIKKPKSQAATHLRLAIKVGYKRLLFPSIANELRQEALELSEQQAISLFASNVTQLLMAPPLGPRRIMGIDPGFRSGCKLVCIDETGELMHNETIFPHTSATLKKTAASKINTLASQYKIDAIAIGNGTASRETELFISHIKFNRTLRVFVVSEAGASVYSASALARQEFPEYDVTVRGAISIARRLMDPLAELVKIDPASLGVGQYQHDVNAAALKASLDNAVASCVNAVGIDLNTASSHLLKHVSGIGEKLAENIISFRAKKGTFKTREALKKVPRLGVNVFEQCAGFLRVRESNNALDNTAIHPESYTVVEQIAKQYGTTTQGLLHNQSLLDSIDASSMATKLNNKNIGEETLKDILTELEKPGRDIRMAGKLVEFDKSLKNMNDLKPEMILNGVVTNITAFGAFVDVGVKQDGLVHVSKMADEFVSDPLTIVKLHQQVKVKVMEVDISRKRIQFSMRPSDLANEPG